MPKHDTLLDELEVEHKLQILTNARQQNLAKAYAISIDMEILKAHPNTARELLQLETQYKALRTSIRVLDEQIAAETAKKAAQPTDE